MIKQPHTSSAVERQAQLEQSFLELLKARPYPQITVTDICKNAAIPRRTFYHYFDSKDAVLHSMIDGMIRRCSMEVVLDLEGDYDTLKASLTRNFRYWLEAVRPMTDALLENNLEGELVSQAIKWVNEEQCGISRRAGLNAKQIEIATTAGIASFFAILHYWRNNNYQETPEEMAEYTAWFLAEPLFRKN